MKRIALLSLLVLMPVVVGATKVYRWVDAGGQVQYSQVPPPVGQAEVVQPHALPPSGIPAAASDGVAPSVDATAKFLEETDAANKAEAEAKAKAREARDTKQKNCIDARTRLTFLDERPAYRLATKNPDGSYTRMDEGEFNKRKAEAQKDVDANCH